ncbi:hypothetical protein INT43_003861 [Umbelopsis isabellina]|uniref:3-methylaspartate ammonia-lyase n=1 Tax=Mortierella isabellina TaxID=91625 RepID=A0A8H7PT57_MORIS|nr:hypothetical protein INT43_003861 [Umbelopsis isabellina]
MTGIKIVTPIGMLGYGYSEALLYKGLAMGAKAIIVDSGSTDSGPQKLALGESTCPREAYVRDLAPILDACWHHSVKVLIGSAGGDGSNAHVDDFLDIIQEYSLRKKYKFKVIKIYSEIDKNVLHEAFDRGEISPCGAVPELEECEIDAATRVVAQMGMEPFVEAMNDHPDFDIIIAGRAYDPSPYAAFCYANGYTDLGNIYHMSKIMECGGLCSLPKSKEALATLWHDKFEITPLDPLSRCTAQSLAAHTLYEKARPDLLAGPGGILDVRSVTYTENSQDGRSCIGSGAKFIPASPYTVKLEGAKTIGYRTIVMGSIRDPILISAIDHYLPEVEKYVHSKCDNCELVFHVYGKDRTTPLPSVARILEQEVFILVEAKSSTQAAATMAASAARIALLHGPYPGQKATAGNFAISLTPLEIPLGQVSEFNIYHLMQVADPISLFPRTDVILGSDKTVEREPDFGFSLIKATKNETILEPKAKVPVSFSNGFSKLPSSSKDGKVYLHTLAKIIRSKNAGPYEVTFDIIFYDNASLERARASNQLIPEVLGPLYNVEPEKIIACMFYEQANAFKFTIPRWAPTGGFGEIDLHASQQHVPLMFIPV